MNKLLNAGDMMQDLMAIKQQAVKKIDGTVEFMFSAKDVKSMLCEVEGWGYARAEMFIFGGVCDICTGSGYISAFNSHTGEKYTGEFSEMICWKCGGDGKLPAKCSRKKLGL